MKISSVIVYGDLVLNKLINTLFCLSVYMLLPQIWIDG